MKNLMMIGSALLVLTSSAYASQARLLALGMSETDNEGMYFIQDSRNMFLNPAYINLYPNQAVFEWGSAGQYINAAGSGTSDATVNNNTSNPKAQGGVFKKYGDFVYGLYLGNESNTSSLLRIAGTSAAAAVNGGGADSRMLHTADNQFDIFFGSETNGLKWAGNATFSKGKDEAQSSKDSAAAIRGGVIGSNWDAHLNLSVNSKSERTDSITVGAQTDAATAQEFKGKLGFHVGGSYLLDSKNRVFGYVKHYGWDQTDSFSKYAALGGTQGGQQGTVKGDFTSYYLGWGRDFDVNNGDKIFTSLTAKKTDINLNFSRKSEVRHLIVPVTFGYEAKANDWLTLRGSVIQNLYGQRDNKLIEGYSATGTQLNKVASSVIKGIYGGNGKTTIANSTVVNGGATLAFGNLTVDGLIGTTDAAGTTSSKKGVLSWSNLETSVAATYKF